MKKSFYPKLLQRVIAVRAFKSFGYPSSFPYKLTFVITNLCNSHCRTCFIWKYYKDNPKQLEKELKTSEVKKIINKVSRDIYWLNFTGGEPTLRKDLPEIVEYAAKKLNNLGTINFPCNGLLPKTIYSIYKKIAERVPEHIQVYVTLSLDGPAKVHDYVRGTPGAYSKVMQAYKLLKPLEKKHKNFHVNFQATISKYTVNSFKKHFDFINSLADFNIYTFAHETDLFKNVEKDVSAMSDEEYKRKLIEALKYAAKKTKVNSPEKVVQSIYLKLAVKFVSTGKLPIPCAASFATITVDPFGEVTPCPFLGSSIGNVRAHDYNLHRIYASKKSKEMQKMIHEGRCPACWMNCEAYPSIFEVFPTAFLKSLG